MSTQQLSAMAQNVASLRRLLEFRGISEYQASYIRHDKSFYLEALARQGYVLGQQSKLKGTPYSSRPPSPRQAGPVDEFVEPSDSPPAAHLSSSQVEADALPASLSRDRREKLTRALRRIDLAAERHKARASRQRG